MKTTASFRLLAFVGLVSGLATLVSAQTRHAWNFDDALGTPLPGAVNSAVTPAYAADTAIPNFGAFLTDTPGVATDGLGGLSIRYAAATTTTAYAPIGNFAGADSGIFTLTVTVAGWHLPAGSTNLQTVYFDLRNAAVLTASLVTELTFLAGDAGVSVRFRDSNAGNNNTFLTGLPITRTTPFTLHLTVDKNAKTYRLSYTDAGVTTEAIPERPLSLGTVTTPGSAARAITHFSLRTLGDFTNAGAVVPEGEPTPHFTVDSIVFASVLTPLQKWRQTHFSVLEADAATPQAADAADPDGDGLPNLLEYATGTLPTVANLSPVTVTPTPEGFLSLAYPSLTDFDLSYAVQASSDLATWQDLARARGTALVAGPQLVTDTVPFTPGPRRFIRLEVRR